MRWNKKVIEALNKSSFLKKFVGMFRLLYEINEKRKEYERKNHYFTQQEIDSVKFFLQRRGFFINVELY